MAQTYKTSTQKILVKIRDNELMQFSNVTLPFQKHKIAYNNIQNSPLLKKSMP